MKIVNLLGGLGNQMFEYAMFMALKDAHPEEIIKVCTRSYCGYGLHNGLEIQRVFGVELPEASLLDLSRLAYPFFNYKTWQFMRHILPPRISMTRGSLSKAFDYNEVLRKTSTYYEGYWQNEKNFEKIRETILKVFTFPSFDDKKNQDLSEVVTSCKSISCHIRRGDYLRDPLWGVCGEDYYYNALIKAKEENEIDLVCVFSDDIEWCRTHLSEIIEGSNVIYIDWNKGENSFRDMQLMSLCKYNIIANSSFSWWGAWLNQYKEKVVYAPDKWFNGAVVNDPICDDWVRINTGKIMDISF